MERRPEIERDIDVETVIAPSVVADPTPVSDAASAVAVPVTLAPAAAEVARLPSPPTQTIIVPRQSLLTMLEDVHLNTELVIGSFTELGGHMFAGSAWLKSRPPHSIPATPQVVFEAAAAEAQASQGFTVLSLTSDDLLGCKTEEGHVELMPRRSEHVDRLYIRGLD